MRDQLERARKLERFLEAAREASTLREAAAKAGIPYEEARIYAVGLASTGLLKTLRIRGSACNCTTCPLKGICPLKRA